MLVRPIERRPLGQMASGALGVDFRLLMFQQFGAPGSVHEMTGDAADLVLGVTGRDAASRCALIQVAGKARTIHFTRRQFGRVMNVVSRRGLGVLGPGAMTGFAALLFPATAGAGLDGEVRSLLKVVVDFFVAYLASIRT